MLMLRVTVRIRVIEECLERMLMEEYLSLEVLIMMLLMNFIKIIMPIKSIKFWNIRMMYLDMIV